MGKQNALKEDNREWGEQEGGSNGGRREGGGTVVFTSG